MNQLKILKINLFILFGMQNFIFASENSLHKVIENVEAQITLIDIRQSFNSEPVKLMAYDEARDKVVQVIHREEVLVASKSSTLRRIKRDSCCYYCFLAPVAIVISAITLDTRHTIINGLSRKICVNTIQYGKDLLEKKNQ